MSKRLISFIIAVALLLTFVPTSVFASGNITVDEIEIKYPGDSVTVSGTATFERVTLQVYRPNGTLFDVDSTKVKEGIYSYTFGLPLENIPFGTYRIAVGRGEEVTTTTFELRDFGEDATLKDLTIDGETVADFDADVLEYRVTLPYGTTTPLQVGATANDDNASLIITQATTVAAYDATPSDTDKATIVVTAHNNVDKSTYTVVFVQEAPSTDADLSDLTVAGVTIENFSADVFEYEVWLPYGTTTPLQVGAVAKDDSASLKITQATSVAAYDATPSDTDRATIVVTAQDGTTIKTYTVAFFAIPVSINPIDTKYVGESVTISGNTVLDRVTIKIIRPDDLLLDADSVDVINGTYSYTFVIPPEIPEGMYIVVAGKGEIAVTTTFEIIDVVQAEKVIVLSDSDEITENKGTMQMSAVVEGVGGAPVDQDVTWSVEPGTGTATISEEGLLTALTNGTVTVRATSVVTPWVSGTKVITISNQKTDGLTDLSISPGEIMFDSEIVMYNVVLASEVESIRVTPVGPEGATIKVNDIVLAEESIDVDLNAGNNTITIVVEEEGKLSMTYTINAKRLPFDIVEGSIEKEGGIESQVTINPVESGRAVIIFKLMEGSTPVAIVAIEDTFDEPKTFSGLFPGYAGEGYSVRVFVWDSLTNDVHYIGEDLAEPITL